MATAETTRSAIPIKNRVTCPHCWHVFAPEQTLWIAQHPDLVGDPRLGPDQQQRFLPTRFTIDCAALDSKGFACHGLACPKCHLAVPRPLFEMKSVFLSILGTPACGKSYFLAALTWQLRKTLPRDFSLAFSDADPVSNHILHQYEELQFLNPNQDALVEIKKTEAQGDLYDEVAFGGEGGVVSFPRPFLFSMRPLERHPNYAAADQISRALCLYDNAGESFLPGADKATSPVTRHLALSRGLMFLFDPTQDPRFRLACQGKSSDPQMQMRNERLARESASRQDTVLLEAAARVRRYAGLAQNAKHSRPLVVVVTKYDAWSSLFGDERLPTPWYKEGYAPGVSAFDTAKVEHYSKKLRDLLWEHSPEIVAAAEGFASEVIYIPISATGCSPQIDEKTGVKGIRPRDVNPMWVEVPMLYLLCKDMGGIIPFVKPGRGPRESPRAVPSDGNGNGHAASHPGATPQTEAAS